MEYVLVIGVTGAAAPNDEKISSGSASTHLSIAIMAYTLLVGRHA
jgi:hypothetical protein